MFTMGSPMVFQTAPPHPASKARMTWSPQFAGGPDASQNGLGQRMPAKFVVRSATADLQHALRGALAVGDGIHHLAAAVHTVTSGIIFRIAGTARGAVHDDEAVLRVHRKRRGQARLTERGNHHVAVHLVFGARNRPRSRAAAR